jgi:hypothetical protein
MTVGELYEELTQLIAEGYSDAPVIMQELGEVGQVWRGPAGTDDEAEVWLS